MQERFRGSLLPLRRRLGCLWMSLHKHSGLDGAYTTQARPWWEWNNDFRMSNNMTNNLTAGYYRISSQARSHAPVDCFILPSFSMNIASS